MFRLVALFVSLIGLTMAPAVSAQSLNLVSVPVVFVRMPVVQQVHAGQRIAPLEAVVTDVEAGPTAIPAAITPQPRATPQLAYAPLWRAPAIDHARRDYRRSVAQYGPFVVLDDRRAALMGETDARTPGAFRAMIRAFPGLAQIDMVECPGTRDDQANMKLGRMIRAAQIVTYVPPIGSVRSGAVELFLAGTERGIADGAEFAVHSWRDEYGREAEDFADDAPENRQYVDYYREMGMADSQARAFYAMTNSVPHRSARWLDARDMRGWLALRTVQMARNAANPTFEYVNAVRF